MTTTTGNKAGTNKLNYESLGGDTIKFFTSSVNFITLPGVSSNVVKTECILSFHDSFISSAVGS